ncbi:hypothetical protein [Sphingobacterium composti Ten et al. 2007 non Yoo et al. 2007]|uniref:hypothetical protein n=1 Tax=Sphingobacterium composti TaxID=363260 RepID=UPI00135AB8F6|nr:hypothetical protein [Sphingobacterium composti Ten et al. 2007 non Yoo et al. 2007]
MKIIIIDHEPYSYRRAKHYYINDFRAVGYEVEYWCVWQVFEYCKKLKYSYQESGDGIVYFFDLNTLLAELNVQNTKSTFLFVDLRFKFDTAILFEKIKNNNFNWGKLAYYHNPVQGYLHGYDKHLETGIIYRFKFWIHTIFNILKNIKNLKMSVFLIKLNFIPGYYESLYTSTIQFLTGNARVDLSPSKKYVSLNYFDILEYNHQKTKLSLIDQPYIVFLDIFLGKHPDLEINNSANYMDVELYYSKLNLFFDKLEKFYQMPVIIAAHPKSEYTNEFGERLCIKHQTSNLVINSELVLNHCSLSSSFALLSKRPLVHIYDSTFIENSVLRPIYKIAYNIASQINGPIINIDNFDLKELKYYKVDDILYDKALEKYFRSKNQNNLDDYEIIRENIEIILN